MNTFIIRDMNHRSPYQDMTDDPSLVAIRTFFERKGEELRNVEWATKCRRPDLKGGYTIERCLGETDLSELAETERFIVLNSDGSYHSRTYFLVNALKKERLSYIHLDTHPDFGHTYDFVDSAGFVGNIASLNNVQKIYLIGVSPEVLRNYAERENDRIRFNGLDETSSIFNKQIEIFPAENDSDLVNTYGLNCKPLEEFDPELISTEKAYLSIDLDVIDKYPTPYTDGKLTFSQVKDVVSKIAQSGKVFGADICGYYIKYDGRTDTALEQMYEIYQVLKANA